MESGLGKVQALFDACDPHGDGTLDGESVLQIFKEVDPQEALWTQGNITHMLESAAPGCKGSIRHQQLLAWVFSSVGTILQDKQTKTALVPTDTTSLENSESQAILVSQTPAEVEHESKDPNEGSSVKPPPPAQKEEDHVVFLQTAALVVTRKGDQNEGSPEKCASSVLSRSVDCNERLTVTCSPTTQKKKSLSERRKVSIGGMSIVPPTKTEGVTPLSSPKLESPLQACESQVSRKEELRMQFERSATSPLPLEPMTDTRHKVKAWGRSVSSDGMSLWDRRKAEMKQKSEECSSLEVETLKMQSLNAPTSPKRATGAKRRSFFETIPEDGMAKVNSSPTLLRPTRRKKSVDRNKFMSGM